MNTKKGGSIKMSDTKNILREKEEVLKLEVNTDPEIVLRDDVGGRLNDWWGDAVVTEMPFEWFRIRKEDNRIIIEPVKVEPIA